MAHHVTQHAKIRLLKLGGGFYLGWLVVGFLGFCYAALIQDFYTTSHALSLSACVAVALSLPILMPAIRTFPRPNNLFALATTLVKYLGAGLLLPLIFSFFTYWWLPRVIHSFVAERVVNSYIVASVNERQAFRGCNTHYWVKLREWSSRVREKVCIDEGSWAKLRPGTRVTLVESVSSLGAVIHELRIDG